MKERFRKGIEGFRVASSRVAEAASEHRYWLQLGILTLLTVAALGAWGLSSTRRQAANRARLAELERVDAAYDRWARDLQLPTPAESLAWRESEASLTDLGQESNRSLAIARLIAARAAEVGVSNLRVSLAQADSIPNVDGVVFGGWQAQPAGEGLVVEFDAGFAGVMAFLAALPVQAAVSDLSLSDAGGVLHARFVIATRRIQRNG
jgi:hypothetical protein